MPRLIAVFALIVALAAGFSVSAPPKAAAHRDGCHAAHSCPSDTGSYVCGDTGNYSQCGYGPPPEAPVEVAPPPPVVDPPLPAEEVPPVAPEQPVSVPDAQLTDAEVGLVVLMARLPSADEVPEGLVLDDESERGAEDVARSLAGQSASDDDIDDALQQLGRWGWYFAAERQFVPADDEQVTPDGIRELGLVVHRFDNEDGAEDGFSGLVEATESADDIEVVRVAKLGDDTRGLFQEDDGTFSLWIRDGMDVIWIGGTSESEFPRQLVEDVAERILLDSGTDFEVGASATTGGPANLRARPSLTGDIVGAIQPGMIVEVTGAASVADGYVWLPVLQADAGSDGFVAVDLLIAVADAGDVAAGVASSGNTGGVAAPEVAVAPAAPEVPVNTGEVPAPTAPPVPVAPVAPTAPAPVTTDSGGDLDCTDFGT
jgi:hypothetical protein